jgi:hypothetical protein
VPRSYRASFVKIALLAPLAVLFWWAALDDYHHLKHNRHEVAIEFLLAIAVSLGLAWLLALKLTVSDTGISYRSLFGSTTIRWQDVKEIYSWKDRRTALYVIPLWQACRFVLVTAAGTRMVFGSRFRGGCFAGEQAILFTAQRLYNRAAERFNRGHEVPFGPFRLSQKGVWTDGWKKGTYSWTEIAAVEESSGGLFLELSDGRTAGGRGVGQIPNVQILIQIIQMGIALAKKGEPIQLPIMGA